MDSFSPRSRNVAAVRNYVFRNETPSPLSHTVGMQVDIVNTEHNSKGLNHINVNSNGLSLETQAPPNDL